MVLYELITLKLPFEQLDTCDIITAVLEGEKVPSMEIDENIREKYWSLIDLHKKCTSRDQNIRPSWKAIISSLTSIIRGENYKPNLTSQKSRMSLTAQLSLYDVRSSCDADTFETIEEIEEKNGVKNASVRFRGPQLLHSNNESFDEKSESTEVEIPMSVYKKLNRVSKEKRDEINSSPANSRDPEKLPVILAPVEHSNSMNEVVTPKEGRKITRKIILEIKDEIGNVIREEIIENSDEESGIERSSNSRDPSPRSPDRSPRDPNFKKANSSPVVILRDKKKKKVKKTPRRSNEIKRKSAKESSQEVSETESKKSKEEKSKEEQSKD